MPKIQYNSETLLIRWPKEIIKKIRQVAKKYRHGKKIFWSCARSNGDLSFLPDDYIGTNYLSKYYSAISSGRKGGVLRSKKNNVKDRAIVDMISMRTSHPHSKKYLKTLVPKVRKYINEKSLEVIFGSKWELK